MKKSKKKFTVVAGFSGTSVPVVFVTPKVTLSKKRKKK